VSPGIITLSTVSILLPDTDMDVIEGLHSGSIDVAQLPDGIKLAAAMPDSAAVPSLPGIPAGSQPAGGPTAYMLTQLLVQVLQPLQSRATPLIAVQTTDGAGPYVVYAPWLNMNLIDVSNTMVIDGCIVWRIQV
jgi:hypothetical protein